jgi:aldehyde dehydrogenase (NAD+)
VTTSLLLQKHNNYFIRGTTRNITWRRQQLRQIKKLISENETSFFEALQQDLSKPIFETWIAETSYITSEVDYVLKRLKSWSKPRNVRTPLVAQPGRAFITSEPQGTVLIIGAWNYPVQLIFAPLIAIIAAGNCAIIKPSELSPATSKLIARLLPLYLDEEAFSVVEGGVEETTELLSYAFDHIMYTGNGQVGRIVMAAAAKHLTPVTLELGGKSPVYVDESADITITAQRLVWGKWFNAGQTCIAPDYLLVQENCVADLITALKKQLILMFGDNAKTSESYGRIVNQRHTNRLANYLVEENLRSGEIITGGIVDVEQQYIEPTIVLEPALDSLLMTEEIFGPILPIITIKDFDKAKAFIQARDKPLSAYIFSKNDLQLSQWVNEISAGSQGINDVILFNSVPELSIGGVGASGMGQYSGKIGFDNFSNLKSVLKRPFIKDLPVRFAPYSQLKLKLLRLIR